MKVQVRVDDVAGQCLIYVASLVMGAIYLET